MSNDSQQTLRQPWSVVYSDHSGNSYRFWLAGEAETRRFSYSPVTPEQSSSGTYSGGEPQKGTLSEAEADALIAAVLALEKACDGHTGARRKGTGTFRVVEEGTGERRFIFGGGSRLRQFDLLLKPFRTGRQN